jgi:hypothetical protein
MLVCEWVHKMHIIYTYSLHTHCLSHGLKTMVTNTGTTTLVRQAEKKKNITCNTRHTQSVWSLVSSFPVMQKDFFSVITQVQQVAVSRSIFISIFENGTHKMCLWRIRETATAARRMQICYLNFTAILSLVTQIQATSFSHICNLQILHCLPLDILHLASVLYMWC